MRIIPARAGFTPSGGRSVPGPRDHPRSRGVYTPIVVTSRDVAGSSPLARGLLGRSLRPYSPAGIIPARAGFTLLAGVGAGRVRDHPRSRGVYPVTTRADLERLGSSPLARGLLSASTWTSTPMRIIPARAGFTGRRPRRRRHGQDHPRSRGVYCPFRGERTTRTGSSPLARGLQRTPSQEYRARWIIPARAGFTPMSSPQISCGGDHPRSRGVYHPRPPT